jgi:hypothetical protein
LPPPVVDRPLSTGKNPESPLIVLTERLQKGKHLSIEKSMNTEYFRYAAPVSQDNSRELSAIAEQKPVSVERFGYVARLINGADDEYLRASGATFSQMAAHKRFRHAVYRRSLNSLRRDYGILEARALAGMQEQDVTIEEIVKSRWTVKFEIAKLEWAGVMYRLGIPAGNHVAEILANLQSALIPANAVSMASAA